MDKNKPMMMIIIALLVLLLGTVVAVTFYLISAFGSEDNGDDSRLTPAQLIMPNEIEWRELEEIRTNLQDPPPNRWSMYIIASFMVGVNATVSNRELAEFNQAFNYSVARMIANEVLYSTSYAEARTPEGRVAIEERILARLQLQFGPLIVEVGAREWVIS